MAEGRRAHLVARDATNDHHLAQLALPTRSLSPWSLIKRDDSDDPCAGARSCDTPSSLLVKEDDENSTFRASSSSASEKIVSNEFMLTADTVIPTSIHAVSLSRILRLIIVSKKHRLHDRNRYPESWRLYCLGLTTRGFWISMSQASCEHGLKMRFISTTTRQCYAQPKFLLPAAWRPGILVECSRSRPTACQRCQLCFEGLAHKQPLGDRSNGAVGF